MDVMNWLGIPENLRDLAVLSLTHRSMLNIDKNFNKDKLDKLLFYYKIGQEVFEAILIKFISQNYSLNVSDLNNVMNANKSPLIIYERLKLNELAVFHKNQNRNNEEKIMSDLAYQFFGFLYLDISFEYAYKLFIRIFTKKDVKLTSNYLSIINNLAKGKSICFEEVKDLKPPYCGYTYYRLIFNEKQVCAGAFSKKAAKKMCAQLYCKEYVSEKKIMEILGYNKKQFKGEQKYNFSEVYLENIEKIATKWKFAKTDMYNVTINRVLYNEYAFVDCSHMVTIGEFYEKIILEKIIYQQYNSYNFNIKYDIAMYLSNNNMLFERLIEIIGMKELFLLKEKVYSQVSKNVVYKDAVRQLIYYAFENNNKLFFNMYEKVILSFIMRKTNPYLQNPVDRIYKMYEKMKEEKPDIIVIKREDIVQHIIQKVNFIVKVPAIFNGKTVYYQGEGDTKAIAIEKAHEKFWLYVYNSINEVFIQHDEKKYEWFLDIISNHLNWFAWYLTEIHHPICKAYTTNDYIEFIKYLHRFYKNIKSYNNGSLVLKIREALYDKKITIKICNEDVLLYAIWEYIDNPQENFSISQHIDDIIALSCNVWKEILKKNGKVIDYISNPNEELQMIAVQQCTESINYIETPTNDVVKYVYDKESIDRMEIRPQVINGLIEVKKQEIENFVAEFKDYDKNVLVLEQHCFDLYLRAIMKLYEIKKFYIACGFVCASGIKMLRSEIDDLLENGMEIKILAGNLQHYFSDNSKMQMDLETALELQKIMKKGVELKTVTDCFYHGKMYFLICEDFTFVIVGSTNMSRNAFRFNSELDNMFIYRTQENLHMKHFKKLWNDATLIEELDTTKFSSAVDNIDIETLNVVDINTVYEKIRQIDDESLRNRLITWLKYKPSNIYNKLDVAGREYIAIEYVEKKMIVLESFFPGNAYFVFYNSQIDNLLKSIEGKSKMEIFELSGMEKRGYHITEQLNLEMKIKSYFL